MKQNFFVVDEKKYYTGSIFVVKDMGQPVEAAFICYDSSCDRYFYKIKDCRYSVRRKQFWQLFVYPTNRVDTNIHMPMIKKKKDVEIEGLMLGWLLYISLMAISTIFKGAIILWILHSVVFFSWRAKRIKERGTYVEW